MSIKSCMEAVCDVYGYEPTENLEKIAKAKERFFTEAQWSRCPCDKDNQDRYCISPLCRADIEGKGRCHCGAYRRRENG